MAGTNGAITWTNERRKLCELVPWEHNPREINKAEAERLGESLQEFGQIQTIAVGPDNEVYDGHQRKLVWSVLPQFGPDYEVDVRVSSRKLTDRERQKLVVFLHRGAVGEWDWDELANSFELPDLLEWGFDEGELIGWAEEDLLGVSKDAKPNPRNLPIDVIFCWGGGDNTCCLAVRAGWKYGIRSGDVEIDGEGICPLVPYSPRHKVVFVDNDFKDYNPAHHLEVIKLTQPKYATVRDYMSRDQCGKAGIAFYELAQVLDWAAELEQYAEHVIVIPKVDVLDQIPEQYILGYSVPTKYGGTPLPVDAFKGRRVHLLGGGWKAQLAHMAALGDDVVSLDNNHLTLIGESWGQFYDPDGTTRVVSDVIGYMPASGRDVAFALSFGAVTTKINELYSGADNPDTKIGAVAETRTIKQGVLE
jgi:hypothetical protein